MRTQKIAWPKNCTIYAMTYGVKNAYFYINPSYTDDKNTYRIT